MVCPSLLVLQLFMHMRNEGTGGTGLSLSVKYKTSYTDPYGLMSGKPRYMVFSHSRKFCHNSRIESWLG